jgi:Na+-transporting methylmalonyl-CoA/oxaloacetate decarboxylase gamma subunit
VPSLIFAAARYEARRFLSHKAYILWSLVVVPFVLPIVLGFVTVLLAVSLRGPPKPVVTSAAAPTLALLDQWSPQLAPWLAAEGVVTVPFAAGAQVELESDLRAGRRPFALLALRDPTGQQTLVVRVAPDESRPPSRLLEQAQAAIQAYQRNRLANALAPLSLSQAEQVSLATAPTLTLDQLARPLDRRLVLLVALAWSSLLLLPYFQLARAGSASIVNDRLGGLLLGVSSGLLSVRGWILSRWLVLAALGAALVLYYAALLLVFMWGYGALADRLVSAGLIEQLSSGQAEQARVALIEFVAAWRDLSWTTLLPMLLLALVQSATVAAILLLGSTLASGVSASRLFELVPFALMFFLPFLALGNVGSADLSPAVMLTGLNTVFALATVLRDGPIDMGLPVAVVAVNSLWLALSLEWAARRARRESFLAPALA